MPAILDDIAAYKRREVAQAKRRESLSAVESRAREAPPVRDFPSALRRRRADGGFGLIAEIKKASPSKGVIRADFDPPRLAEAYARGGACCLSVLTDGPSFQGAPDDLVAARAACDLPALRKDFMLDPYQIVESRALGADCLLVIMALTDDVLARELAETARDWGMAVLVEVHDGHELERAVALGSPLIGINNRDLQSFETTIETSLALAPHVPDQCHLVSESGLRTAGDLARLAAAGITSFLIGESLMRCADVTAATQALLRRAHCAPAVKRASRS